MLASDKQIWLLYIGITSHYERNKALICDAQQLPLDVLFMARGQPQKVKKLEVICVKSSAQVVGHDRKQTGHC